MKTLASLVISVSLFSGLIANAADVAPAVSHRLGTALPAPLAKPIARLRVGYGFVIGSVAAYEITLLADGNTRVTELVIERDAATGREIGRKNVDVVTNEYFDSEVMAKITASLALQTDSELVDQDADKPVYEDGPGYQYFVIRDDKELLFASNFGGHTSLPIEHKRQRAAKYLKADLDNLFQAILAEQPANDADGDVHD